MCKGDGELGTTMETLVKGLFTDQNLCRLNAALSVYVIAALYRHGEAMLLEELPIALSASLLARA